MQRMKSRRSSMPLSWPRAVPRSARRRLDACGSFSFHRQPLWEDEHFEDRSVELSGNLLAVAVRGGLILRRGEETRVIRQGDACLLSAGPLTVTEVPPTAIGSADILYIFFGDKAVRQRFADLAQAERLSLTMAPAPTALPLLAKFLLHVTPFLSADGRREPNDFTRLLNVMFNHGWAGAWMFMKAFFARRRDLHLYLERHVFPISTVERIVEEYPGGRQRFGRDFRAQYDVPVERWLTWRWLEVARLKIRYEKSLSVARIAAAAGYRNFHRFRHQFRRRFGLWPEDIRRKESRDELSPQELAPFWHWSYPASLYVREAARAHLGRVYNAQHPRSKRRRLSQEDLIWSGHAEYEPLPSRRISSPHAETMDEVRANVIPFESSGFDKFLEREASLDPADMPQAIAA